MSDYDPNNALAKLAQAIIAGLGDGWTIDAARSYAHHVNVDGPDARFYIRDENYTGGAPVRLAMAGAVPPSIPLERVNEAGYGIDFGKMTAAADRPVEKICADIERRLLPKARAGWQRVLDNERRDNANHAARLAALQSLAALISNPITNEGTPQDDRSRVESGAGVRPMTDWSLDYTGTHVDIELKGVPLALARQIAALVHPPQ